MKRLEGNIVDIHKQKIYPGTIFIKDGIIQSITPNKNRYTHFISPGFVDAHVHIESSMLTPENFSKLAISKGTIAIVNDPHEIANVLGRVGVNYMLENSAKASIKMFFTIPSCVPATLFDCTGSEISFADTKELLESGKFIGLSEMMDVPGVLSKDTAIIQKLALFSSRELPIDGHAPKLRGKELQQYIEAGISTDHECVDLEEALEKIQRGMKIIIREGSAAKSYEILKSLISLYPDQLMFCTDDSHPNDLLWEGQIDKIVKRAIKDGFDLFDVLRIASWNPIQHYGLKVGTLQIGDAADFVVFEDLNTFEVLSVWIEGEEKYRKEKRTVFPRSRISSSHNKNLNLFNRTDIKLSSLQQAVEKEITAIELIQDEIITQKRIFSVFPQANLESDLARDILKIVYLNRYDSSKPPQVGYITGVGLKKGAFASSVSHDSHNIVAVGCDDESLLKAINTVIHEKGGLCVADQEEVLVLPLPIAGIMTCWPGEKVADRWEQLVQKLHNLGCRLNSPFMTLAFMALLVIPELKIGEQGLFEFSSFSFMEQKKKDNRRKI